MPFHPGNEKLFRKVTSSPVGETWRNGEIVVDGLTLKVCYLSNVELDLTGEVGVEILGQFQDRHGRTARGVFQVRCQFVRGALEMSSTRRMGEKENE